MLILYLNKLKLLINEAINKLEGNYGNLNSI